MLAPGHIPSGAILTPLASGRLRAAAPKDFETIVREIVWVSPSREHSDRFIADFGAPLCAAGFRLYQTRHIDCADEDLVAYLFYYAHLVGIVVAAPISPAAALLDPRNLADPSHRGCAGPG